MASTSEVGHAKNVAHFHTLITYCEGFGTPYAPPARLSIPQLSVVKALAETHIANIIPVNTAYDRTINERVVSFEGLQSLSVRIMGALEACGASRQTIDDATVYHKKIQGSRSTKSQTAIAPGTTPPDTISVSQLSYDQLIQHFEGLISVAAAEPLYAPNETDLRITNLQDRLTDMKAKNNALAAAHFAVASARMARNNTLYHPETGLVSIAADVKAYVKSVFGVSSPEYKLINALRFRTN